MTRTAAQQSGSGSKSHSAHAARSAPPDTKDQQLCELELQRTVAEARIRELEVANRRLEEAQTRLTNSFYEHAPVGYITFDRKGYIVESNATALLLLGHDSTSLKERPFKFFVQREDWNLFISHLQRCRTGNGTKAITELRLQSKGRGAIPVQLTSVPMDNAGQYLCRTVLVDLAERKRNEHALAQAKEFAESIVQTVRQPLVVLDSDLRIMSVNRAFSDYFKKTAESVKQRPFEVILHLWWSGNRLRSVLDRVLIKNEPLENFQLEVEPPTLGKRVLLLNARRLYQKENLPGHILVAFEDITDRKAAEDLIRHISHDLEQRVEARTEDLRKSYQQMEAFCYSIAHDLRAPLRSMVGFSDLLGEIYGPQLDRPAQNYLEKIRQSGKRMDRMILDLLDYGRLNTIHLPLEKIDLEKVFHEVIARHVKDIEEKRAVIRKKKPLPSIYGHRVVLEVALTNLISNALKFVSHGVRPKIVIWPEEQDDFVRICVQDNGIGINPEDAKKIFGVFQRRIPRPTLIQEPALAWPWSAKAWNALAAGPEWNHIPAKAADSGLTCQENNESRPKQRPPNNPS